MIRYLLLLALLFSFGASAQVISITTPGNVTYNMGTDLGGGSFDVTHAGTGSFTDVFQFTLTQETVRDQPVGGNYGGMDITSFGLYTSSGALIESGDIAPAATLGQVYGLLGPATLLAGSYYYQITGPAADATGNSYILQALVSPVPEPSTYALMLVGLAALGWIAIRRSRTPRLAL
jgi:hypothetical protein